MSLFKKKKNNSLFEQLDNELAVAKDISHTNFYFPLSPEDKENAYKWAKSHGLTIELSHKNGDLLVYKIGGIYYE